MNTYAKKWLKTLIEAPSVTPNDCGLLNIIGSELSSDGFEVLRLDKGEVKNLLATKGSGPLLLFVGHVDVVPASGNWLYPPFKLTKDNDKYYGRGTADMKGAIAAFMAAIKNFNGSFKIGLALTSDEEGEAINGSAIIAEHLKSTPPAAVLVGEPSCTVFGDTIRVGRRGSLYGNLTLKGAASHVAYGPGNSAIVKLRQFLNDFYAIDWSKIPNVDHTTAHIVKIEAGVATNVVPPESRIQINWRFNGDTSYIKQQLAQYTIEYNLASLPFKTQTGPLHAALIGAIRNTCSLTPTESMGGGTSDGRFFAPLGSEVIEFGLCNETIHQVNEHILIDDFRKLVEIYTKVISNIQLL